MSILGFFRFHHNYWKLLGQFIFLIISILAIIDLNGFPNHSVKWQIFRYSFIAFILLFNVFIFSFLFAQLGCELISIFKRIPKVIRLAIVVVMILLPGLFRLFIDKNGYLSGYYIMLFIYLAVSILSAFLFITNLNYEQLFQRLLFSLGISAFIFGLFTLLASVNNSPFSSFWSEGNRFYDYSLIFGKNLYRSVGAVKIPYDSPGRYALWGLPFLLPGLPIWAHRLWDAILWGFFPLLLTLILTNKIQKPLIRWGVALWGALFIMQGPVYPHLLVPLIILASFLQSKKTYIRVFFLFCVSFYVAISRYIWVVLPAIWYVNYDFIVLFPNRSGHWLKRAFIPFLISLFGLVFGVIFILLRVLNPAKSFISIQSLLFYRLFPNNTYQEGILLGIAILTVPLIIVLIYLISSGFWQIHITAKVSIFVSLLSLLIMGLIVSIKIGGGSNLHNLDMFILTLVFITLLAITQLQSKCNFSELYNKRWLIFLTCICMVLPGWVAYRSFPAVPKIDYELEFEALESIQENVRLASSNGEVLFIDQRQLLTFGYIQDIVLIPEYEKKYMMDQALVKNAEYFNGFYNDLKTKRFKLIISDILKTTYQKEAESFSEENNAYVKWVSRPVLDYYEPILTIKELGIQLLVPK